MHSNDCHSCREYQALSRRQFIGAAGGAALAATSVPYWLPRVVYASDHCSARDIIISIYLRGGCDGLTMCVPHVEDAYYDARPTLAVPRPDSGQPNAAIDLDGFFGFPPAMMPLLEAYYAGHLAIVHATGSMHASRSHFDAQRFMEVGEPGNTTEFTGWLGRHLMTSPPLQPNALLRAVGINYGLQRSLVGGPATLPVPDLADFGLTGNQQSELQRRAVLADVYGLVADPLKAAAENTQATMDLLENIDFENYVPSGGAVYPETPLGYSLKSAAALIKAQVGVEAVAVDLDGWDTHAQQGPFEGAMASLMSDLSGTLAALHADLFTDLTNITVVCMSEFGRRFEENGSLGTDHGHGNVMMVMGDNIAGGRVVTEWPGLGPQQLYQGIDLDVTIDFRDILAEIVSRRLGNPNLEVVFPNFTPTLRGVTKACFTPTARFGK